MINVGQTHCNEGVLIKAIQKHEEELYYEDPCTLDSVHEVRNLLW